MRVLGLFLLVGMLATSGVVISPVRADVVISAGAANMCLDVQSDPNQRRSATQLPMLVKLWTCNGGPNQNFFTASYGAQTFNGLCLDMASPNQGASIVMAPCRGTTSQAWSLVTNLRDPNNGRLRNQSGWCVNIPGGRAQEGTQLVAWTCQRGYGGWNDMWARGKYTNDGSVLALASLQSQMNTLGRLFTSDPISRTPTPLIGSDSAGVITLSGGNVVAAGGGNVIAAGGGNVTILSGGAVIAAGGGNLLSTNGGNFIGHDAGNSGLFIGHDTGNSGYATNPAGIISDHAGGAPNH